MKTAPGGRAAFAFVFVTVAIDMLALGIVVPVLPSLLIEFQGGDFARAARLTGWFGFAWALMQFFAAPLLGALSDQVGRRPVLLLSMAGLGLDYVLMAVAPSTGWLLVGRLISGVTAATGPIATAYVADVTAPTERSARFGKLGAAFGFGFIAGPALGGFLGEIDLRLPFWAAAGLSLANALYGAFILPESLPADRRRPFDWRHAHPAGALALWRSRPELAGFAAALFLTALAHESLPNLLVLYMGHRYGWNEGTIGLAVTAIGASSALVAAGLVGPSVKRLGDRSTATAGFTCAAFGLAIYGLATTGPWFVAGIPFVALWGLGNAPLQALMSQRVASTEQGRLQGAIAGLRGITGMMGPLFFTGIFATAIGPSVARPVPGAPFFVAAALLAVAGAIAWRVAAPAATKTQAQDKDFHIFLCFGQSNMEGFPGIPEEDKAYHDPRFLVLAATDFPSLAREAGKWYPAFPPLCRPDSGLSPADHFGRTLVANLPAHIKVGISSVAVAGAGIELFDETTRPAYAATAPAWMKSIIATYGGSPYQRLVEMGRLAQQSGVIKGILLHQGESNTNDPEWPTKVRKVYENLIQDLDLQAANVPLLAGGVVAADQQGACAGMNEIIAGLPKIIPTAHIVSSTGCPCHPDRLHFTSDGYRELGRRYAETLLSLPGYRQPETK